MPPTLIYLSKIPQSESVLCLEYQSALSVCLKIIFGNTRSSLSDHSSGSNLLGGKWTCCVPKTALKNNVCAYNKVK